MPRRPESTVLYRVVQRHVATLLAHARETYERQLPRYVENELRGYLKCGIFAHGFVRCHCDACGHDALVAFSCKSRGICPSCAARRMSSGAAHLVDRVLPNVPVRQWVLSLPFELRRLAAFRPEVLTAIARIFYESVAADHRTRAALADGETAAVTCVQRFGGSVNLNPHLHDLWADGVFTFEGGVARFHHVAPPSRDALDHLVRKIARRIARWLARRGLLGDGFAHASGAERASIDGFADISLFGGGLEALGERTSPDDGEHDRFERRQTRFSAEHGGFSLHAGVRIEADDDEGRERLCRYALRPCFALERLTELSDGRLAYRVKAACGRRTHRIMTPLELLARLCALVPPPRYPLVRYHGVLAPRSPRRKLVVPRREAPRRSPRCEDRCGGDARRVCRAGHGEAGGANERATRASSGPRRVGYGAPSHGARLEGAPWIALALREAASPLEPAAELVVNTITVRHWGRLLDGALLATSPRLDWATLLRRTYGVDALECPKCHGRMRPMAVITEPAVARKILAHLGMVPDAPVAARARDPTWDDAPRDDAPEQLTLPWGDS